MFRALMQHSMSTGLLSMCFKYMSTSLYVLKAHIYYSHKGKYGKYMFYHQAYFAML